MSVDTDLRQREMQDVLQRFRATRPEMKVQISIYPAASESIGSCRGICNPADFFRMESAPQVDESHMPDNIKQSAGLKQLKELKVGDWLHVAVVSAFPGYLHFFNLGTSGSVGKMFPLEKASAQAIPENVKLFITGGDLSPFEQAPYFEKGSGAKDGTGVANGFPERLLAIVTREKIQIKASDLFPDWAVFDRTYRSIDGWGKVDDSGDWFWKMTEKDWQWGLIEVPVVD